jgi:hypothetical protein
MQPSYLVLPQASMQWAKGHFPQQTNVIPCESFGSLQMQHTILIFPVSVQTAPTPPPVTYIANSNTLQNAPPPIFDPQARVTSTMTPKELKPLPVQRNRPGRLKNPLVDGNENYVCPYGGCGRVYKHLNNYRSHARVHTTNAFVCYFCSKKFGRKSNYEAHLKVHERATKPFLCNACFSRFSSRQQLDVHGGVCKVADKESMCVHDIKAEI